MHEARNANVSGLSLSQFSVRASAAVSLRSVALCRGLWKLSTKGMELMPEDWRAESFHVFTEAPKPISGLRQVARATMTVNARFESGL